MDKAKRRLKKNKIGEESSWMKTVEVATFLLMLDPVIVNRGYVCIFACIIQVSSLILLLLPFLLLQFATI